MLGEPVVPVDKPRSPWCIYCHPEVAFAGLSEAVATQAGYDVVVEEGSVRRETAGQRIIGETEGLVKIVAERDQTAGPAGSWRAIWSGRG